MIVAKIIELSILLFFVALFGYGLGYSRAIKAIKDVSKSGEKVEWQEEYGELVPVCPYCNEWVHDKERCVFCGKPYEYWEPEDLPKPTVVEYEGFVIVQTPSNHIQIYDTKDGHIVYHASCTKKLTEDELREHADFLKKIRKGGAEKCVSCGETIPEGRQVCPGCEGGGRDGKIKP